MKLYCGIDLHSNNHWLTIIDEQDGRLVERRLPNDLSVTLQTLEPYRSTLTRDCGGVDIQLVLAGRWSDGGRL